MITRINHSKTLWTIFISILSIAPLVTACGQSGFTPTPSERKTPTIVLPTETITATGSPSSSEPLFVVLGENQTALLAAYESYDTLQVLYQIPTDVGRAQVLFHPAGFPVISRNGMWVTVIENKDEGSSDIVRINLSTQEMARLIDWPGPQFWATISPDGKRVAFLSAEGECPNRQGYAERYWCPDMHVYVMDSTGDNIVRITDKAADRCFLKWSPNGVQISYQESCNPPTYSDYPPQVYVVTLAPDNRPSHMTRLTSSGSGSSWSPDGKWLRWLAVDGVYHLSQVGDEGNVITDTVIGLKGGGVWAPDSQHLGGVTTKGDIEVWGFGMDSPTITAHLQNLSPYVPQQWLADGQRLVFPASKVDAQGKRLSDENWHMVNIDGTNLVEFKFP
jgi:dipeptidyl aminopeptidase/acylaminoacyl peptidase